MNIDDYPLCLNSKQAAAIMGVHQNRIYELARRPDFPCVRDGKKIVIPRDAFWTWLNTKALEPAQRA